MNGSEGFYVSFAPEAYLYHFTYFYHLQKQQPSTTASENDTDQRFGNDRVNQNSELKDAKNSTELRGTADSSTQRLFIYCSYQILIGAPSKGNRDKFGCQGIKHP